MKEAQVSDDDVVAHLAPVRTVVALAMMLIMFAFFAVAGLELASGAWTLTVEEIIAGALILLLLPSLIREAWYLAKALARDRVAIFREGSSLVVFDRAFYSLPISTFDVKTGGGLLEIRPTKGTKGAVRHVPFFWLRERKVIVVERLSALRASSP